MLYFSFFVWCYAVVIKLHKCHCWPVRMHFWASNHSLLICNCSVQCHAMVLGDSGMEMKEWDTVYGYGNGTLYPTRVGFSYVIPILIAINLEWEWVSGDPVGSISSVIHVLMYFSCLGFSRSIWAPPSSYPPGFSMPCFWMVGYITVLFTRKLIFHG